MPRERRLDSDDPAWDAATRSSARFEGRGVRDPLLRRVREIRVGEKPPPKPRRRKPRPKVPRPRPDLPAPDLEKLLCELHALGRRAVGGCICATCKRLRAERNEERRRERANSSRFVRTCPTCGIEFATWREETRYCGRPCWLRELNERKKRGETELGRRVGFVGPYDGGAQ
jgi:hypothetical protein